MKWLRDVALDLIVTVVIVLAVAPGWRWALVAVWIYTPLMLALKVIALVGGRFFVRFSQKEAHVPAWFFHLLYAVNVGVLLLGAQWLLAGGWTLIWLLSIAAERRKQAA